MAIPPPHRVSRVADKLVDEPLIDTAGSEIADKGMSQAVPAVDDAPPAALQYVLKMVVATVASASACSSASNW